MTYILPYYIKSKTTATADSLHIVSINLLSSNTEYKKVKSYIKTKSPDIIVLLELTDNWKEELAVIIKTYPYTNVYPRKDNFGIAVLSKVKMEAQIVYANTQSKPSIIGNFTWKNNPVNIIATHPMPPISQGTLENRNRQLNDLLNKQHLSENLIIIGDFNRSSFSNHFHKLLANNLKDTRIGFGLLPSWPAGILPVQTTLDHCLVTPNFTITNRSVDSNLGSDHFPISVHLALN